LRRLSGELHRRLEAYQTAPPGSPDTLRTVGYFRSSVALDVTAADAFAFLDDEPNLRNFVAAVEPDETFAAPDAAGVAVPAGGAGAGPWFHVGAVHRHRIDWHGSHSHGYLWVIHRGDASDLVAEVRTGIEREGLDARLDAALFAVQDHLDARQGAPAGVPRPEDSASFVVETVLKGLRRHLPVQLRPQLVPYLTGAVTLDGSVAAEARRAAICRSWADSLAAADQVRLGRRAVGFIEHVHHAVAAVDGALVGAEGSAAGAVEAAAERHGRRLIDPEAVAAVDPAAVPGGRRRDLDESYEAVVEAADAAAHQGWESVPWRALLDRLLSV